ncbi:hypothetical protein C0992_012743 [Termitomyces sp. T32_za158]|nr:hypothetical protein C0992_012743 [Termitomyces sp. T32_za158]
MLMSFQENTAYYDLEPSLLNAFVGLGDILMRTKEHLAACSKNRRSHSVDSFLGFLIPSRVIQQLVRDEEQLSHQLTIILFSFSSSSFIREHLSAHVKIPDPLHFRTIRNEEVFDFWRDYLGVKVLFAQTDRFLEALKYRFGNRLTDAARRRLFMRLDEFNIGGVAASTLERFVGDESLEHAVQIFQTIATEKPLPKTPKNDKMLPLLIWVDDRPENNFEEVQFARKLGVCVLEFPSTALLKDWMEENEDFLRSNDSADNIRFISDTARFENDNQRVTQGNNPFLNITAGENIARYLRGHLYHAPLLIFCGSGIVYTDYVKAYEATGSTCWSVIVRQYIKALSQRRGDDKDWQGFKVGERK